MSRGRARIAVAVVLAVAVDFPASAGVVAAVVETVGRHATSGIKRH